MSRSNYVLVFTLILVTFTFTVNSYPDPRRVSNPTQIELSDNRDAFKFRINAEDNVEENIITSAELRENGPEIIQQPNFDNGGRLPEKYSSGKDSSSPVDGKRNLNRFYKHEQQRSVSLSDTIVFPSASSYNPSYDQSFSDIYNKNRPPQSPGPQGPLISFQNFFYPTTRSTEEETSTSRPRFQQNSQPQQGVNRGIFGNLGPEQDFLWTQTLAQIFRGLLTPSGNINFPSNNNRQQFNRQAVEQSVTIPIVDEQPISGEESTTVIAIADQSLYSGPRVQKSPCPNGQDRTRSGGCQEKGRKLRNSG